MSKFQGYNPKKEEIYEVHGDPHAKCGQTSTYNLQKGRMAEVPIRYKDRLIFGDLYRDPDGEGIMLHILCPKCSSPEGTHALQIKSSQKQMSYDPETNLISIEPFGCTWEIGRGTNETHNDRIEFGLGLCNWRVGVTNGIAKDA